jgi:hypothetical protein
MRSAGRNTAAPHGHGCRLRVRPYRWSIVRDFHPAEPAASALTQVWARRPPTISVAAAGCWRLLGSSPSRLASSLTDRLSRCRDRRAGRPCCSLLVGSVYQASASVPLSSGCGCGRLVGVVRSLSRWSALLAVGLAAVGALGAAGDRPGAGGGLGGVAFAVQLHHPRPQHRVVLGRVGDEPAGLSAQRWRSCRALFRSPLSYERALLEAHVQQNVATVRMRLRPAA